MDNGTGMYYTYVVDDERLFRAMDKKQPLHIDVKSLEDLNTIRDVINAYDEIISEYEATVSELSSNAEKYVEKIRDLEASLDFMKRRSDSIEYLNGIYESETNTKSDISEEDDDSIPSFSNMHIERCVLDDDLSSKDIQKMDIMIDSRSGIHINFDSFGGLRIDIK